MWTSLMLFTGVGAYLGAVFFREIPGSVFALTEGEAAGAMLDDDRRDDATRGLSQGSGGDGWVNAARLPRRDLFQNAGVVPPAAAEW